MVISKKMNDLQRKSVETIITKLVSSKKEKSFVAARLIATILYIKKGGYLCTEQGSVSLNSTFPKDDPMYEAVKITFKNIGTDETKLILELLEIITVCGISQDNYLEILDIAISLSTQMQTRLAYLTPKNENAFLQPTEFGQLAERLLNIQGETILNPFAGFMPYATDMHQWSHFTGIIKESEDFPIKEISMLRVALDGMEKCDIISNWPNDKYDIMVSTLLFGTIKLGAAKNIPEDPYITYLERFEESTNSKGRLFCIVFPSFLFNYKYKELREKLTEKNYVDTVIELPIGLLSYTSVQCIAVALDKTRNADAPIKMVNASQMLLEDKSLDVDAVVAAVKDSYSANYIAVTREEIRSKEYDWTPEIYKRQEYPEGYEVLPLNSILEPIRCKRKFSEKQGRVVKISDLSTNVSSYAKDDFNVVDDLSGTMKLEEPALLLSRIGDIRPTYCNATPWQPLFVSKDIQAFRITAEWVHPMYLCLEISRRIKRKRGTLSIPQKIILDTNVAFPSIGTMQSYEAAQKELNSYFQKLEEKRKDTISTCNHDISLFLSEISCIEILMRYYTENEKDLSESYMDEIIYLASRLQSASKKISSIIDTITKEKFGNPEPLDIEKVLSDLNNDDPEYGEEYIEVNYNREALEEYGLPVAHYGLRFPKDSKGEIDWAALGKQIGNDGPFWVKIEPNDLDRLIKNIIDNASKHGFTDDDKRDDYMIEIRLTVDADKDMFQIDFRNNGNPFPKGLNKDTYGQLGQKEGRTAGTGIGGYIVRSIVEHYNGDYDVFMDGDWCVVRILLPIFKQS